MKIKIVCGQCSTGLEAPAALAGESAVCPKCRAKITVPIPELAAVSGNSKSANQNTNPWDVPLTGDVPRSLPPSPFSTQGSASRGLNIPAVTAGVLILLTLIVGAAIGTMIERHRAAGGGSATVSGVPTVPNELQPGPNNQVLIEYYDVSTDRPVILEVSHVFRSDPGLAIVANKAGAKIVINGNYRLYARAPEDISPPPGAPQNTTAPNVPRLGPKYNW